MASEMQAMIAWSQAFWVLQSAHVAGGSRGRKLRKRARALRARVKAAAMAEAKLIREGR